MIAIKGFDTRSYLILQEPDPARKDENYYKTNMLAMYGEWLNKASTVGYAGIYRIDLLRAYANGSQPDDPLRNTNPEPPGAILDVNGNPIPSTDTDPDPTFNPRHEVWQIFSPANKIVEAIDGKLTKLDYDVQCDPLDYATKMLVEDSKLLAWLFKENQEKIALAELIGGVQTDRPPFIPEEPEDLDMNEEKFLPDHAMYAEQVVKHTFDISHWSPTMVKMFIRDLFIIGYGCTRDEYDPETGKIVERYVDPRNADIQPSQYPDHRDSERAWHFELWNLSRVRQHFPDKPEEWFKKVATSSCGMFGNPMGTDFNTYYDKKDPYGQWMYDRFKVPIMYGEWIDIDKTKEVKGTTKFGRSVVKEVPLNSKVAQDKTVRFTESRVRYGAHWVMNTEDVFEYGPAYENSEYLTYHWYTYPGKSKLEQIVPVLKQIEDLWDKYRELLRNAKGRGDIINLDRLSGTGKAGEPLQVTAKKAYQRWLTTYTLFVRGVNIAGNFDNTPPFNQTEGGMGTLFQEVMLGFKNAFEMIEVISGINPLTYGQSTDPNAPVTTTKMAAASTNNVLQPLVDGMVSVKQLAAENIARWAVMLIRGNEFSRKAYSQVVGEYGIQALIAGSKGVKRPGSKEVDEADYGFKMIPRPDDMEKQFILQSVQAAITPNASGDREISTADANRIISMVASGTPAKTIFYYFEKARRKQRSQAMRDKITLMQQQSQLNQQDSAAAAQNASALADKTHGQNMELQRLKNEGLIGNTQLQETTRAQKEKDVQDLKNQGKAEEKILDKAAPVEAE